MRAFDLNVPWDVETKDTLPSTLKTLQDAGYNSVALNHVVESKLPKTQCPFSKIDFPGRKEDFGQYSRLTIVMDNPQHNLGINPSNEIIQSYDFIAIQPLNDKMFQVACNTLEIDIITLDMTSRIPFNIKPGAVRLAVERGIVFELCYGPMIKDSSARRHTISNSLSVLRFLKGGKGVIISSGATASWQVRSPADVANLAGLLGFTQHLRKSSITLHPHAAFMHAASRKHTYRGAVAIEPTEEKLAEQTTDMLDDFIKL